MTHADAHPSDHHCHSNAAADGEPAPTIDPVCGMTVDPAATAHHAEHDGTQFHFCSARCREKFVADPEAYLGTAPRAEPEATPGAIWTCPMHPEIRREGPGTCPRPEERRGGKAWVSKG